MRFGDDAAAAFPINTARSWASAITRDMLSNILRPSRRALVSCVATAVATALLAPGLAFAQPDRVRVASGQAISDAAIYVAKEMGYFTEQNLDVSYELIDTTTTVTTGLASGAIDVAGGSPGAGIYNAARQGIPLKIVADKGRTLPGHGYFAILVRKDLANVIKSPEDLRGRTIGLTGYNGGSSNEVMLSKLLATAKMKETDVNVVGMSFADIFAALGTGRIDAAPLQEPLVARAVDNGSAVVWKRVDEVYPGQQYAALLYGPGITKRPDVAVRFMVAYLKGARFYNDALEGKIPREKLVSILTQNTNVKDKTLYDKMAFPAIASDGKLNIEGMRSDVAWFVSAGRMKQAVKIEDVVDTSYAEKATQILDGAR